jgi:hypothetical protein
MNGFQREQIVLILIVTTDHLPVFQISPAKTGMIGATLFGIHASTFNLQFFRVQNKR